jgi:predicted amidohydrolase
MGCNDLGERLLVSVTLGLVDGYIWKGDALFGGGAEGWELISCLVRHIRVGFGRFLTKGYVMARYKWSVGVLLVAILATGAGAAGERIIGRRALSHGGPGWPRDKVTSIAFSPDGRWLAASYWRYPMNRPRTDWDAFVVQWDLKGKKRTIIPNAYGPIAFNPDSKTLAMGVYKRSYVKGFRTGPQVQMALWDVGASSPRCILPDQDAQPTPPIVAAAWSPDGKRIASIAGPTKLRLWDSDYKSVPVSISVKDIKTNPKRRYRLGAMRLIFTGNESLETICDTYAAYWKRSDQGVVLHSTYQAMWKTENPLTRNMAPPRQGWLYRTRDPQTSAVVADPILRAAPVAWSNRFCFSPNRKLIAIGWCGRTVLRRRDGVLVKTFLCGGGTAAFSPDGKRIATPDSRGIIRIWDIVSSKLIRTLRLDDKKENTVLAAAIQIASKFGDPKGNRKKIKSAVRGAAKRGAKIIVLPETAVTGYMTTDIKTAWQAAGRKVSDGLKGVDPKDVAETVPGVSTKYFASLAREYGVYLTVPLLEVDRKTGKYYNTSVLLGPDERILIHYRKRNPWVWAEKGWADDGNLGNPVIETPYGRLGLLICFDVHKQFKVMSDLKIDTLLYSIAWVDQAGSDWFSKQLPAQAKEHGFNIIGANWTLPKGFKPKWRGYGQSLIISSVGKILAKAKENLVDETVFAEITIPTPAN